MQEKQYYTKAQFARALGVTPVTVWRWIKDGKIKTVIIADKEFIPIEELKIKEKRE